MKCLLFTWFVMNSNPELTDNRDRNWYAPKIFSEFVPSELPCWKFHWDFNKVLLHEGNNELNQLI